MTVAEIDSAVDLTQDSAESLVIELLAEEFGRDSDDVRAELEGEGPQMPVDSLDILDILQALEDRTGLRVKADKKTGRSMRSVRDFATRICEVAGE
jgi:acyl carrier protein